MRRWPRTLGFVAYAAERHTYELAAGGFGDRHSQRGLADSRRSDEAQDRSLGILDQLPHRQEFQDAVFDLFQTVVIFVQDFFRAADVADFLRPLLPWNSQQPVQIVARDRRLGGHGRHGFELLEFLDGLVADFLGHAGGFDLFLQLVELALLAAAQFFLDGLDLLVEVVLFLRPLHLPLDSRLDGAVHVQLFDLDVEHVADPGQTLGGIEDLQQFLFFFDGKLEVGGDGVGQLGRIFHAHGRDHGLVVQRLAQLYILLEQSCDPLHAGFNLRVGLGRIARHAERNLHVAFALADLKNLAALNALDQNLDIAIGQLEALHDVDDSAHLVDLIGLGFVDAGVVLGGQEDLLIGGQRLFQGTNARFPSHHKWGHHVGEDDHVTNGHHGKLFWFRIFPWLWSLFLPTTISPMPPWPIRALSALQFTPPFPSLRV